MSPAVLHLLASGCRSHSLFSRSRLGNIGNGGFSHDFASLKGNTSNVVTAIDSFGFVKPSFAVRMSFLSSVSIVDPYPTHRRDERTYEICLMK